jgi:hypothetical protein
VRIPGPHRGWNVKLYVFLAGHHYHNHLHYRLIWGKMKIPPSGYSYLNVHLYHRQACRFQDGHRPYTCYCKHISLQHINPFLRRVLVKKMLVLRGVKYSYTSYCGLQLSFDTFFQYHMCFTEIRAFTIRIPASFVYFSAVEFCPACTIEYAVMFH